MKDNVYFVVRFVALAALVMSSAMASVEAPSAYKIIHSFGQHGSHGVDGESPYSGLTIDAAGNLYGTTSFNSGAYGGNGVAFELSPMADGRWREAIIHIFQGTDGRTPYSSLTFDAAGNLYGTTTQGGAYSCGTVFELSANNRQESVLYSFAGGSDGCTPGDSVVFDSKGNLYGTTVGGGLVNCINQTLGCGLVFELTPNSGGWTKKVLHEFTGGKDGGMARAGVVLDGNGNVYGTAAFGGMIKKCGTTGCGTIYELTPNSSGRWKFEVLHRFTDGDDGAAPFGTLTLDAENNIYGTTASGGKYVYPGVVFELTRSSTGWKEQVLHAFTGGNDGASPYYETLTFDKAGNIYGTTEAGGVYGNGVVFELMPSPEGTWREKVLHTFGSTSGDGANPYAGVILDSAGRVFGTTLSGGHATIAAGTVFEKTP
ncbi:MAG TPA: choice-of-anchor tandem repeat GloVer-containing protein [Terriglobales bacterium]|nr:choice-of-anchor tandem repeat GloVer-containing protein [Terriglobales bacterium]